MSHLLQNTGSTHIDVKTNSKIVYSNHEHENWSFLYNQQRNKLTSLMHPRLLSALDDLQLPKNHIPQLIDVSNKLLATTGWQVAKVNGLIKATEFFNLLCEKKFPSTIHIRADDELSLSKDPDIFHELFGHCPILMIKEYAEFIHMVGILGLELDKKQQAFLLRLFWFTFEVGLVQYGSEIKIFGGSLASSFLESSLSIYSSEAIRKPYSMLDILRTPYRADIPQNIYYILPDIHFVTSILDSVYLFKEMVNEAYELGEFAPTFSLDENFSKYMSYNLCKNVTL